MCVSHVGKVGSPYLGLRRLQQPHEQRYPFLPVSVCSKLMRPDSGGRLPALRCLTLKRADADACSDCTREWREQRKICMH